MRRVERVFVSREEEKWERDFMMYENPPPKNNFGKKGKEQCMG